MRVRLLFVFAIGAIVFASYGPVRSQDKPDQAAINKKKTLELLEKAQDEYRIFFKRPETTFEFWSAIKFEMDLGKFDLAALHLKLMLEKEPKDVDPDLVKLEEAEGLSAFLRLKKVRQWSDHKPFQDEAAKNVDVLIDRLTKAVETHLSDPVRIKKYIKQLDARTPEERGYAYVQLARSRERAVPYLVEAIRTNYGKSLFSKLRETMLMIGPETVPVYLEVFKAVDGNDKDFRDLELRLTLLDIVKQRDDKRVVPYLWHMSASKKYPDAVRNKAKEVLASMLRIDVLDLPPARESLTQLAERFYQHKVNMPEEKAVTIWKWDGQAISTTPKSYNRDEAEEFFGLRYAREALDLDPSYQPAQVVLLSLLLERTYRPKIDQILKEELPPKTQQLLTTIDGDLLMRVLERGMEERNLPIVLPIIRAMGERGEFRSARPGSGDQPRGLARALHYPDRRVQFGAMLAMLRMPTSSTPAGSNRIVELSRRFLNSEGKAKALIIYAPAGAEDTAKQAVESIGFKGVKANNLTEALDVEHGVKSSADIDLVVLHRGMRDADFPHIYAQLRKDYDTSGLPMIVVVDKAREKNVKRLVGKDAGVMVITDDKFKAGEELKLLWGEHAKKAQVVPLTADERRLFRDTGMGVLITMARGELPGYNIMPALDVIKKQVGSPDFNAPALEILGRLPGRENQVLLARIVADENADLKAMRMPAVIELNRHMQKNSVLIDKNQIEDLKKAAGQAAVGTPLRSQLNVTMSMITRTNAQITGAELFKFRPDELPKKDEKKEEKKEDK